MGAAADAWMIYGATGYTGRLTAERAAAQGLRPVLAGRDEQKLRALASTLDLPFRAFGLDDPARVRAGLEGMKAVLHCAGPFSATSRPMVDGCLAAGTHYLDITGEIDVFEAIFRRDAEAERAGVVLLPGVGFDVVPSDCLAAMLHEKLPFAQELQLAFAGMGKTSPGTAKSSVEGLALGGRARIDGELVRVPYAHRITTVPFHDRPRTCMAIPWGDVSTAYRSTRIPNITVFMAARPRVIRAARLLRPLRLAIGLPPVQKALKRMIERRVTGPTAEERATGRIELWGSVADQAGRSIEMTMTVPEGYDFTVASSLAAVQRILAGGIRPGATTPSRAFGSRFVEDLPRVTVHEGRVSGVPHVC